MTENKRFTLHKGLDTLNIMDNTKFNEHIYINKSSKDMELLVGVLNALHEENEQLKKTIDKLSTFDKTDFIETEHINTIYKEFGFKGVINYAKDKLQEYGAVKEVEKGLWVMVTGGWSDNEFWLKCLNNLASIFAMKHYCAYEKGGAFYYTEKPHDSIEIRLKGDD